MPDAEHVALVARYVLSVADARVEFGDDASGATLRLFQRKDVVGDGDDSFTSPSPFT